MFVNEKSLFWVRAPIPHLKSGKYISPSEPPAGFSSQAYVAAAFSLLAIAAGSQVNGIYVTVI